jgi:hypothetical protein
MPDAIPAVPGTKVVKALGRAGFTNAARSCAASVAANSVRTEPGQGAVRDELTMVLAMLR